MSVNLDNIELGAGELLVCQFAGNTTLFWDAGFYWDTAAQYWPDEYEIGASLNAEYSGKMIGKDIVVGRVAAAVKSATIGAEGSLKVQVAEAGLTNIMIAVGCDPADIVTTGSADSYVFGNDAKKILFALRYTIPKIDDSTKNQIFELFRATAMGLEAMPSSKTEERVFEVSFKLLGEKNQNWALGSFFNEV